MTSTTSETFISSPSSLPSSYFSSSSPPSVAGPFQERYIETMPTKTICDLASYQDNKQFCLTNNILTIDIDDWTCGMKRHRQTLLKWLLTKAHDHETMTDIGTIDRLTFKTELCYYFLFVVRHLSFHYYKKIFILHSHNLVSDLYSL